MRDERAGPCIQDYGGSRLNYSHLRNNSPRSVETFRRDAIGLTRLRQHHQTHSLNRWRIHAGRTMNHPRHRICRLNAMTRTFNSGMAFTHERAERGWGENPSHHHTQENDRSCGSSGHCSKLYLRPYGMRKFGQSPVELAL